MDSYHADPEPDPNVEDKRARFWIVTAISNPMRFKTRYALYRKFRKHVLEEVRANLITVEASLGERAHQVVSEHVSDLTSSTGTTPAGTRYVDVRVSSNSILWLKENLQNVGVSFLPRDAEYVMFSDADLFFHQRHILPTEVINALQIYKVVQPFETCADLGPRQEITQVHRSFGSCYASGLEWRPTLKAPSYAYPGEAPFSAKDAGFGVPWHPGFALAMRRATLDKLGGLLQVGILGAGDHHMCGALIGKADLTLPGAINEHYRKAVLDWQDRALKVVKKNFGYVPGTVLHYFHGPKARRYYVQRWQVLVQSNFDPTKDVRANAAGVLELTSDKPELRDGLRRYFECRNEDSVELT